MNKPRYNDCEICKHEFEAMTTADKLIMAKEAIDEAIRDYTRVKSNSTPTPEPRTTVTVWFCGRVDIHNLPVFEYVEGNNLFAVGTYTFSGTPDIDRVIAETLDKGALAVLVCSKDCSRMMYFQPYIKYNSYFFCGQYHVAYANTDRTVEKIEQAITEYLRCLSC